MLKPIFEMDISFVVGYMKYHPDDDDDDDYYYYYYYLFN